MAGSSSFLFSDQVMELRACLMMKQNKNLKIRSLTCYDIPVNAS
jgi:hypothetical protein